MQWLEYLANRYGGTFHKPDLDLEDDNTPTIPAQAAAKDNYDNDIDWVDSDDEKDEDEAVPMKGSAKERDSVLEVRVRSQDTRLRENYQQALVQGKVISLTSATRNSSMRSTFQSISSSVTALRTGTNLKERHVKIEEQSTMIQFPATRMVLNADFDKVNVAAGETSNGRIVQVSVHPFAQGGLRNVYRMKQKGEPRQVAKESRHDIKYQDRLRFHLETAKCQAQAAVYAFAFNKKLRKASRKKPDFPQFRAVKFLSAEVYRLSDDRYPGGFRYLAVEQEMSGTYDKWNNNNGYVNNSTCTMCQTAQAFRYGFV